MLHLVKNYVFSKYHQNQLSSYGEENTNKLPQFLFMFGTFSCTAKGNHAVRAAVLTTRMFKS